MTKNVAIVRQAIEVVTRLLSEKNVKVTQRGDQAFVHYNTKTGAVERVNIPYLPDGASEELIAAVQGFLDHEVAHILFTDPAVSGEIKKRSTDTRHHKRLHGTHNMLEDCFIEKNMERRFKGSAVNLGNVRKLVFDTRARVMIDELLQKGKLNTEVDWFRILNVTMFRAWAGHQECIDFMEEGDKWDHMPTLTRKLGFIETEIDKCRTSFDVLDLAERVLKAIEEDEEDEEEQSEEDQSGKSSSKQKSKSKGDKSKKSAKGDESSTSEESESEDGKSDTDASSKDDEKEEEQGGNGQSEDEEDGDEGSGSGDSDDQDDEKESEGGDDSSGADESEDGDAGDDEQDGEESNQTELHLDPDAAADSLGDAPDFEKALSQEITKVFQTLNEEKALGDWLIFSREYDKPVPYDAGGCSSGDVSNMMDQVNSMIAPMSKQLERLILSQKRSVFEPGRRSGRLHSAALHRLVSGDERVFRRKHETRIKNTAVELLVDMSGSMGGSKMQTAAYSAFALSKMLQTVNIANEVISFSTGYSHSGGAPHSYFDEMQKAEKRLGRIFSHRGVCTHRILKDFNERLNPKINERFAHLGANKSHLMAANCDPESIEMAAMRLAQRPERRRVLMVLSDGAPSFNGDNNGAGVRMRELIKMCEREEMEVIGIGIEDDAVRKYYPKHLVLNSVQQLPEAIMGEMKRILFN